MRDGRIAIVAKLRTRNTFWYLDGAVTQQGSNLMQMASWRPDGSGLASNGIRLPEHDLMIRAS